MPKCRSCRAPIFFLTEQPEHYNAGTWDQPKQAISQPSPKPINVDPDGEGTFAIYEFNGKRYLRAMRGEARSMFKKAGGVLYRIHFDTCPARR